MFTEITELRVINMKLSDVKISLTVPMMKATTMQPGKSLSQLDEDITNQLNIVTKFLGDKFLNECMEQAEICLNDNEKFDEIYLKFKKVGNQFSTQIEEG